MEVNSRNLPNLGHTELLFQLTVLQRLHNSNLQPDPPLKLLNSLTQPDLGPSRLFPAKQEPGQRAAAGGPSFAGKKSQGSAGTLSSPTSEDLAVPSRYVGRALHKQDACQKYSCQLNCCVQSKHEV